MARNLDFRFELQFPANEIENYARRYQFTEDTKPREAGQRIASGDYSRANLEEIFEWKTKGRGRAGIARNSEIEIADALRLACLATTPNAAIAVLCGLQGIDIPVASAVMTAINPTQFTIVDFRATEALGHKSNNPSIRFYLKYLECCRDLSEKNGISLRTLDRALWQWSSELSKKRRSEKY